MFQMVRRLIFRPARCQCERVPHDAFVLQACHPVYARYIDRPGSKRAVMFSHGISEDMYKRLDLMDEISKRLNVSVLHYEYCGYGCSAGEANEVCMLNSSEAAFNWLAERWPENKIIVWGKSIGSGPASYLASKRNVGGVVIESGFLSSFEQAKDLTGMLAPLFVSLGPLLNAFIPLDGFPNDQWLAQSDAPILVLHGTDDRMVLPRHAKTLAYNLDADLWQGPGGHDRLEGSPGYWSTIEHWFGKLR